jgi:hypothetical protein
MLYTVLVACCLRAAAACTRTVSATDSELVLHLCAAQSLLKLSYKKAALAYMTCYCTAVKLKQFHIHTATHTYNNKQDKDKRGTVTRLQWANGLKLVLQLDVPFLSYLDRLADVDADGNVNYTNFLERYRVQVSACVHARSHCVYYSTLYVHTYTYYHCALLKHVQSVE